MHNNKYTKLRLVGDVIDVLPDKIHISAVRNELINFKAERDKKRKFEVLDRIHKLQREIYSLLEELKELGGK